MVAGQGVHFADFASEYEAILAQARQVVGLFPPLLRDLAEPLLPQLGDGSFSRIVALLPYWLADLLEKQGSSEGGQPPSTAGDTQALGLVNLLGWWSYRIQDELLDRELDRPELLALAMAFHAAAIRLLVKVLPGDEAFWDAFQALSLESAEAYVWEQRRHLQSLADLDVLEYDPDAFDLDDLDRLAGRSALLRLAALAPLALRGYRPADPLSTALAEMLRHYAMARQVADDRTDWVEDLRCGRLNYVSARILRRMVETGRMPSYADWDAERMAGYFLYDDVLFVDIQRLIQAACRRAAQLLAPYGPSYLAALVDELAVQSELSYQAALDTRHKLQELFSPLQPLP